MPESRKSPARCVSVVKLGRMAEAQRLLARALDGDSDRARSLITSWMVRTASPPAHCARAKRLAGESVLSSRPCRNGRTLRGRLSQAFWGKSRVGQSAVTPKSARVAQTPPRSRSNAVQGAAAKCRPGSAPCCRKSMIDVVPPAPAMPCSAPGGGADDVRERFYSEDGAARIEQGASPGARRAAPALPSGTAEARTQQYFAVIRTPRGNARCHPFHTSTHTAFSWNAR